MAKKIPQKEFSILIKIPGQKPLEVKFDADIKQVLIARAQRLRKSLRDYLTAIFNQKPG